MIFADIVVMFAHGVVISHGVVIFYRRACSYCCIMVLLARDVLLDLLMGSVGLLGIERGARGSRLLLIHLGMGGAGETEAKGCDSG